MGKVVHYVAEDGTDYFDEWLQNQDTGIRARVQTRIDRVELGNFGDHKGGLASAFPSFESTSAPDTACTMASTARNS